MDKKQKVADLKLLIENYQQIIKALHDKGNISDSIYQACKEYQHVYEKHTQSIENLKLIVENYQQVIQSLYDNGKISSKIFEACQEYKRLYQTYLK